MISNKRKLNKQVNCIDDSIGNSGYKLNKRAHKIDIGYYITFNDKRCSLLQLKVVVLLIQSNRN